MKTAIRLCEETLPKIRENLKRARTLQFLGQLLDVIGGASIFGLLALSHPTIAKYTAALLALAGSLLLVFSQRAGSSLQPDGTLFEVYRVIVECRSQAKEIEQQLEPWILSGYKGTSQLPLISKVNEVCYRIDNELSKI